MPSYVAFTESERLIGEAAKNQAAMNPKNTIFDAKRLIGRNFSDKIVQDDMKLWPFKVRFPRASVSTPPVRELTLTSWLNRLFRAATTNR